MQREIELKLELDPKMARRLRTVPVFAQQPKYRQLQETTYFDTPDRKLRKAGLTLRVRQSDRRCIQTVKAQNEAAGLFARDEWESEVSAMRPDRKAALSTPVGNVLSANGLRALEPVASLSVNRSCWVVDSKDAVMEVLLDEGVIGAGNARQLLSELELELKEGSEKALFRLCNQIGDRVPLRLSVLSKAERAFSMGDANRNRVTKASSIDLPIGASAADAFTAIALSCIRHFRLNEPLLLGSRTPEALHQAHVALRRLRSAFSLFRPILREGPRCRWIRKELRWSSRKLGEARNVDVLLALLRHSSLEDSSVLLAREKHYRAVAKMLNSSRFLRMMLGLLRWLFVGRWRESARAQVPVRSLAEWRADVAWAALSQDAAPIAEMTTEQRHRFRIRTKQLRYALEFMQSVLPNAQGKRTSFLASLNSLLDTLGELNDLVIARQAAREIGIEWEPESVDRASVEALLGKAQDDLSSLLDPGPYWRTDDPKPLGATVAHRRGGEGRPGASRTP
jgi:inorganic triphosphatase YgiF